MNKHLLSINDLSREEIESILATARIDFFDLSKRDIKKVPTLRGRTIIDIFYEKSTRTSTSFELAGKRLSADVINVKADSSSVGKGESLKDTVLTLSAYRPDIIVIRHPHVGAAAFVARCVDTGLDGGSAFGIEGRGAHVINAGDGKGEHPTQCLLDIFSLQQVYGELDGLKVAIVGDILHSRVARSNIIGFQKMGMEVTLIAPPGLLPRGVEALGLETEAAGVERGSQQEEALPGARESDAGATVVDQKGGGKETTLRVAHSLDALTDMDVIYLLRLQKERHESGNFIPSLREYVSRYQVGLRHLRRGQKVLHPGPINRGIEISADLADSQENLILQQVEAGLALRMAVLYRIIVDNAAASKEAGVKNIQAVG